MQSILKKITLILIFALSTILSFAQLNNPDNWKFIQSPEKINDILEDGNELWFGTEHGLVILNKETFEQTYYTRNNSELPSEDVKAIEIIGDTKFIGTYDLVLLQINEDGWASTNIPIDESQLLVGETPLLYCMKADPEGNLWIGTNYGVVKYDGENFRIFHHDNTPEASATFQDVWNIAVDESGNLIFGSFEMYQYDGETFTNLSEENIHLFSYGDAIMTYGGEKLWFSNFNSNIAWKDDSGWHYLDSDQLPGSILNGIEIDNNGKPYFYFSAGVYTIEDEQIVETVDFEVATDGMDQLFFDQNNDLWAIKNAAFYTKNENGIMTETGTLGDTPLRNNKLSAIVEDKTGKIYMINDDKHIITYDYDEGWGEMVIPNLSPFAPIYNIAFDSQNDLWATCSYGLLHFDGEEWELLNTANNPEVPFVGSYLITIDSYDRIWLFAYGKLVLFDHGNWSSFTNDNTPWDLAKAIITDNDDYLWLADTKGQLFRIALDGSYTQINTSSILSLDHSGIESLHFDHSGRLWVVTNTDGIFQLNDNQWIPLEDNYDGYYGSGFTITEDENGMYVTSRHGILNFTEEGTIAYISDENSLLQNENSLYLLTMDSHGSLWAYSYNSGISIYNEGGFLTAIQEAPRHTIPTWQTYPNPAGQVIRVEAASTPFASGTTVTLRLINSIGQIIQSYQIEVLGEGKISYDLNVEKLKSGIYFLEIEGLGVQRVVKY